MFSKPKPPSQPKLSRVTNHGWVFGQAAGFVSTREICPKRNILDKIHIEKFGDKCPFKHLEYHWPARTTSENCVISDSICKYVNQLYDTEVHAYPGKRIEDIYHKILSKEIDVSKYWVIVIHASSNNLSDDTIENVLQYFRKIVDLIKRNNKYVHVVVSAIIPKLFDEESLQKKRINWNNELRVMCKATNCHFIETWKKFENFNQHLKRIVFMEELYTKKDGIHLNEAGTKVLKDYLETNIIRIKGKLPKEVKEKNQ